MKFHKVDKDPAKISEIEWRDVIYIMNAQRLEWKNNLVLGNTRELNRVSVTKCLPYIHLANSLYYTKLSLP